jgi:DNA mismatch repair protein MutL
MQGYADNSVQYIYINGRMMRDKLIMHALRQAYEGLIPERQHAAYVLYLTLPPSAFDVNVHPAKHEVRFVESRMVHDFVYQTVADRLQAGFADSPSPFPAEHVPNHDYIQPLRDSAARDEQHSHASFTGEKRPSAAAIGQYQALLQPTDGAQLDAEAGLQWLLLADMRWLVQGSSLRVLSAAHLVEYWVSQLVALSETQVPLLLPVAVNVPSTFALGDFADFQCERMNNKLILKRVPSRMRQFPWSSIVPLWAEQKTLTQASALTCLARVPTLRTELLSWLQASPAPQLQQLFDSARPCQLNLVEP